MCRHLAAIAVSAAAAVAVFALPPAAHAAARPAIRTYTERADAAFTGIGSNKGYSSATSGSEKVVLGPRLVVAADWRDAYELHGAHSSSGQVDIIGDRKYVRNGNSQWTASTLSARALRSWTGDLNPYATLAKFDALHGARRTGTGHFQVTGTYKQVGSFVVFEFGLTADSFKGSGIETLTISMTLDSSGRPVRITAVGRSSTTAFTATETFARYNKPVTIDVP